MSVNVEDEELNVKKVKTISHLGKLSLEDSRKLLEQFNGDVVLAVEYARELHYKEHPMELNEKGIRDMIESMKPVVEMIQSKYTDGEITKMRQQLKAKNDKNRDKFIEGLIYGYMDKLD